MLILGIDPGLQKAGWGIIESEGSAIRFIASGLIKTNSKDDMAVRLNTLHRGIESAITEHSPDSAVIEETFVNKNPASALKLGQARGVLMNAAALSGLEVAEYSANKIKKSVVGAGHASKDQIGMMISRLLPGCGAISEDEADALAACITHAHYGQWNKTLKKA